MELVLKYTMYRKETKDKKWMENPSRPVNFKKDEEGNYYDANQEKLRFYGTVKKAMTSTKLPSVRSDTISMKHYGVYKKKSEKT